MPLSADEPIRALIAADMAFNGHYIAPELNGEVYLNKPPLYNWILLGFFKAFGSFSEWVVRLPSILSLLLWALIIVRIVEKELGDLRLGFIAAFALVTSGNLWFYSSYLGHIDVTYSLVTFLQLYALIKFGKEGTWLKAFVISYILATTGFMMKGLPSIAFQGISIITILITQRDIKRLFDWRHLVSTLIFVIPVVVYLLAFGNNYEVSDLLKKLLTESSSRTVTDKGFIESISHIFAFPFQYLVDIMPWGLSILIFIRKDARKMVWGNRFMKYSILLFLTNIIIYWLSPDYRARYVFMLTPFLLIPSLYACMKMISQENMARIIYSISTLVLLASLIITHPPAGIIGPPPPVKESVNVLVLGFLFFYQIFRLTRKFKAPPILVLVSALVILRVCYTQFVVPFRVDTGPYLTEKTEGKRIAEITSGEPLAMYHGNIALTMNWYITIHRKEMLTTQTKDFDFSSYYLVAKEVIRDTSNVDTYFTFVRRFEQKPFELVKFKYRFPEMPKKKD